MIRSGFLVAALIGGLLAPRPAAAERHDVRGFLSQRGLDFIAAQVPSYVPAKLAPPPASGTIGCVQATQRNNALDLAVEGFRLTVPQEGRLRLDVTVSASGKGELFAKGAVFCNGDLTCQDAFSVRHVRAIVDLDVALRSGAPDVSMVALDVKVNPKDVFISFSGCAVGDLATNVIEFAKGWAMDFVLGKVEELAATQLAPMIEKMMVGIGYDGEVGPIGFGASLEDFALTASGIAVGGKIEMTALADAAACVAADDDGAPGDLDGDRPNLAASPAHLSMAANIGIVNDAIYQAWHAGLLCVSEAQLAALGVALPLDMAAELLPGFPPGTKLSVEVQMHDPPRLAGIADDDASLELTIEDLDVALIGALPDGSERRLEVGVSATASATIGVDRASNALIAELTGARLDHLEVDQVSASRYGFDVGRIEDVVEHVIVPKVMAEIGQTPVTGPVFSAEGYAVVLRQLATTDAYLSAHVDLFRVPVGDLSPPDTAMTSFPRGVVTPHDAIVSISGSDGLSPLELLQYRVWVDGVERAPSFVRSFKVGEPGVSKSYQVEVRAVDLSGNLDPTPATTVVAVDGIAPTLVLDGERTLVEEGPIELRWRASDDQTATDQLALRAEIYTVDEADDLLAVTLRETRVLPPGSTAATIEGLSGDHLFRVDLHAVDAAGNDSTASVLLDLRTGGCAAGGGAGGGAVVVLLAALLLRRRRR